MLPFAAKDRIRREFVADYPLSVTHPATDQVHDVTITPEVVFGHHAGDADYPSITLTFGPVGILRATDQPLSDRMREELSNDPTIAYERYVGERVYDELTITVAVAGDHGSIPGAIVAQELTSRVYAHARHGLDHLNTQGDDYEWPVLVRPLTSTNAVADISDPEGTTRSHEGDDGRPVYRHAMDFAVNYTTTVEQIVEAVDDIEYTLTISDQAGDEL